MHLPIPTGEILYMADQNKPHAITDIQLEIKKIMKKKTLSLHIPRSLFFFVCLIGHAVQNCLNTVFWLNLTRYKTLSQTNWSCSPNLINKIIKLEKNTSLELGLNKTYSWYKDAKWLS